MQSVRNIEKQSQIKSIYFHSYKKHYLVEYLKYDIKLFYAFVENLESYSEIIVFPCQLL